MSGERQANFERTDVAEIWELIRLVGADHCIVATDFGHHLAAPPLEGLRLFVAALLHLGATHTEIGLLIRRNPCLLLGLD